jgi:hypothetical protein
MFYGSKTWKDWKLLSDFGKEIGAHGGVWNVRFSQCWTVQMITNGLCC